MPSCVFTLNGALLSTLACEKGSFASFSGDGANRNKAESTGVVDAGPIPLGRYYIVDRASGGLLGSARDWITGRDGWFALYKDDGSVDDQTFVGAVRRGEFRLHPLGPSRSSHGCIVLQYPPEFEILQRFLRGSAIQHIPDTGMRTYGTVDVVRPERAPDILEPRFRNGGRGSPERVA